MSTETARTRRAAMAFIVVTILLDTVAFGIALPVLPSLITHVSGGDAARVAEIFGVFGTMFFLLQLFGAPVQGALSDSFGRRPIIIASNIGLGLDFVLMALAPTLPWLFAGRIVSGALSGSASAAYAYMIDVTPPDKRTRMFAYFNAATSAGVALGPALGGFIGSYDLRAPFWVAAILCLINGLYGLLVLPESLSQERRARFTWHLANPVGVSFSLLKRYPVLLWWGVNIFLFGFALLGVNSIFSVYLSYRFDWSPKNIGLYLAILGVWSMATQGIIVPALTKFIKDRAAAVSGGLIGSVFIAAMGLIPSGVGYVALALFWSLSFGINNVGYASLITRVVGDSEQGQLQGAARSVNSIAGLLAPGAWTLMLAWSIKAGGKPLSGLPYLVTGLLTVLATLILFRITKPAKHLAP